MPAAAIDKATLLERLAEGRAAGITVVTPNQRLARALRLEFDSFQQARNLSVWEDADILPLDAFVARCYEDALYDEGGESLPTLLSPLQSRALWEEAIRASRWAGALLDVPQTAARAMDAWRLAQVWRIAGGLEKFAVGEDTQAFAEWASAYERLLRKGGFVDGALLWDFEFGKRTLVAYAFDIAPAQAADFFARFESLSCNPGRAVGKAAKTSFASPGEELDAAARWARGQLAAGRARIGVVVPDLKLRRREAARVFERVMGSPLPFELSIGEPLAACPMVEFALSLLEFRYFERPFENASRLIRSPFLGGADAEMAARARLDARLRREAQAAVSLPRLIGLIDGCAGLRQRLERVFEQQAEGQSPLDWARHFTALLDAAGFPGDRTLDSNEFQARARFNELLGELSRLGIVAPGLSVQKALGRLRRLCTETLFQPEGNAAPVQVLGLLESVGLEFDALWVSGLIDAAWPQRVHPDPFLPVALQRKAGIPVASAEASLALDRQRTQGWLGAAKEVVFSWARREEDRELSPSPLIAQVPDGTIELPAFVSYRDLIFSSRAVESFEDEKANPLNSKAVKGGTRVLADQAACPFRAYARHRLAAQALDAPEPGLDAMQRGQLLHTLMAEIWKQLGSSASLSGDLKPFIEKAAAKAVEDIEGGFAELEKQRLIRLAGEWLEVERGRPPFEVTVTEDKRSMEIGGLTLSGRIDRMDKLADGGHALIDYKTGRATKSSWLGDRPDEPQLPLYVLGAKENVTAVAFATLRVGAMKFSGFSAREQEIPGVAAAKSWSGLVATWKRDLERLAEGFASGDARVDPKKGFATCRQCDLQPLCRVHERLGALQDDGEVE